MPVNEGPSYGIDADELLGIMALSEKYMDKIGSSDAWTEKIKSMGGRLVVETGTLVQNAEYPFFELSEPTFPRDWNALVLVTTPPGEGGEVWLTSNCQIDVFERGQVTRTSKPLEEAMGVTLLGASEDTALLTMAPGSGIRICRNGRLGRDKAPELTVTWMGRFHKDRPLEGIRVYSKYQRTSRSQSMSAHRAA